jgi:hypothetical protein
MAAPKQPPYTHPGHGDVSPGAEKCPSMERYKLHLKANLEIRFSLHGLPRRQLCRFIGSRVETRRFQAMGVDCIQLVQPHLDA